MSRILVVDDEEYMLEVLSVLLSSEGHEVETALSGPIALEKMKQAPIDLVISDVRMSPMNGMELLRRVREVWSDMPFIVLTAYGSEKTQSDAARMGAFRYLTKPFEVDEVLAAVNGALASKA
jgi:DNA-binding NtrC family response regulator